MQRIPFSISPPFFMHNVPSRFFAPSPLPNKALCCWFESGWTRSNDCLVILFCFFTTSPPTRYLFIRHHNFIRTLQIIDTVRSRSAYIFSNPILAWSPRAMLWSDFPAACGSFPIHLLHQSRHDISESHCPEPISQLLITHLFGPRHSGRLEVRTRSVPELLNLSHSSQIPYVIWTFTCRWETRTLVQGKRRKPG